MNALTPLQKRTAIFLSLILFAAAPSIPIAAKTTAPDLVPADALGYVQVTDIYPLIETVKESPEWEELSGIEGVQTALMQTRQIVPVVQMITGMEWEEFIKTFGRQITLTVLRVSDHPAMALIFDVEGSKELAEDALEQLLMLMSADAKFDATPERHEYAGVTFNSRSLADGNIIEYGFLDNFMLFTLNDAFKPLVDVYQGKTLSIATTPEFQEVARKVAPSGTVYAYANLQRTIPALEAADAAKKGETFQPPEDEMEAAILKSPQGIAVKLGLLGDTHEVYVRLRPQGPAVMFAPLLLRKHPELVSIRFLPAINGAFIGLQLDDPVETWTQLSELATMMGHNLDEAIDEIETEMGFALKGDLLDALTGEIGVGISLPMGAVKLKEHPIDFAKFQPVLAIGVKDRQKFDAIPTLITPLVQMDHFASSTERSEGIRRGIVTADAIAPGVAIAPWYTFSGDLFVASTSRPQLEAIVTQIENPIPQSAEGFSVPPWALVHMNVGKVATFFVQQNLPEDLHVPEHAVTKLPNLGTIQITYGADSEGIKLTLTTAADETWLSNLLNALVVVAYAEQD